LNALLLKDEWMIGKMTKQMAQWNPWHGCNKISPGCKNCYVYRFDAAFDRDASKILKTADFDLPLN
jgi:protein gp37